MMREEILNVQGLQVSYKTAGEGPAVLILHGWGSSSASWQSVQVGLSQQGYEVIIPDLPGFGKSAEPRSPWGIEKYRVFVEEFVNALGLKEFYLLGHSFGGGLALAYTAKNPERVKKLFLVAAAIRREKSLRKHILRTAAKIGKFFSFLPFYALFRKAVYKYIIRTSDYPYQKGIMKDIYLKVIGQDLFPLLSEVKVPTVILWGEKDDVVSVEDAYFIKKHIKDSQLALFPEGDHDIEQKMPHAFTQKILEFLF